MCSAYWALLGEIIREPCNPKDAMTLPQWLQWQAAMEEEMHCIKELGTWDLVLKPADTNIVSCKWVYKLKRNQKGEVSRYKARLVAQGFTRVPGVDYVDMFAPVAKFSTLCVLLTLAASHNCISEWKTHRNNLHETAPELHRLWKPYAHVLTCTWPLWSVAVWAHVVPDPCEGIQRAWLRHVHGRPHHLCVAQAKQEGDCCCVNWRPAHDQQAPKEIRSS